jgi:hypothetical protein
MISKSCTHYNWPPIRVPVCPDRQSALLPRCHTSPLPARRHLGPRSWSDSLFVRVHLPAMIPEENRRNRACPLFQSTIPLISDSECIFRCPAGSTASPRPRALEKVCIFRSEISCRASAPGPQGRFCSKRIERVSGGFARLSQTPRSLESGMADWVNAFLDESDRE